MMKSHTCEDPFLGPISRTHFSDPSRLRIRANKAVAPGAASLCRAANPESITDSQIVVDGDGKDDEEDGTKLTAETALAILTPAAYVFVAECRASLDTRWNQLCCAPHIWTWTGFLNHHGTSFSETSAYVLTLYDTWLERGFSAAS